MDGCMLRLPTLRNLRTMLQAMLRSVNVEISDHRYRRETPRPASNAKERQATPSLPNAENCDDIMKCDIDVNAVGCNGWLWLETECRERGKWRRNSCCSAAEDADNRILQRTSLFH